MASSARTTIEPVPGSRIEQIKQAIYDEWQSPAITAAYRTWNTQETAWGSKLTELIVDRARVAPGMTVLDLASGHGEPALALAAAVAPTGHATATDQGPALLTIAEERAREAGLTNLTFRVADAHALPFPDATFDRVTARHGVMYFVEPGRALNEVYRVLKPGGQVTFTAWGSFDQPLFAMLVQPLLTYITPPMPEPGTPDPFMYAAPGSLAAVLGNAGFRDLEEEHMTVSTPFPGTPEQYWAWWWDMAPPIQPLLDALSTVRKRQVKEAAIAALQAYDDGTVISVPVEVVAASGGR